MKKKTTHSNIKRSSKSKKDNSDITHSTYLEDYLDLFTFKMKPVTEGFIDRLSQELMVWADSSERKRLKLTQFINAKKIPIGTFYRWKERHPNLQAAHQYALSVLGDKREVGVAIREYDSSILKMMHIYDSDWKEAEIWRAGLKAESDESANQKRYTIVEEKVLIPNFGSSSLVPERKKVHEKDHSE